MIGRLKIAFPYLFFAAMAAGVAWSNFSRQDLTVGKGTRLTDPVCRMDVNEAWGFQSEHEGVTFHFCSNRCVKVFQADPDEHIGQRCMVCPKPVTAESGFPGTYMEQTYYLCSEDHRREFKSDPAGFFMHRMWGIPDWMYYISIAAVLLVSFLMFEGLAALGKNRPDDYQANHSRSTDRIDLMRVPLIRRMLLSRPFRFTVQSITAALFILIIVAGLFGNQNPALNIAPLLTWTIWWGGLVVLIMFAGKAWCYLCPWDAIAFWVEKLHLWKKTDAGSGLGLPWPRVIRNISIATILFVGLTWIELGFGVTMRPRVTAYLGLTMLVMAIVSAFLFDRKSFCRYVCLVGRVSGLYALFSGIEFRPRNKDTCRRCATKECFTGSETAYGCPTFEHPHSMQTNTYCIQCAECLQACPHDNMAVNLRPWGEDLAVLDKPRSDEAYLALLMLTITGFHGLTMTPSWQALIDSVQTALPLGRVSAFSLSMFVLMTAPILIYAALVWLSFAVSTRHVKADAGSAASLSYYDYFVRYAYCVLPIALFYHLAHNVEHLLMEGQKVITLFSDPFGWGWNLFGTLGHTFPPLVSLDVLWILQVILVGIGHVYSLWAAQKISRRIFASATASARGQWPILLGMIAFSILSLWLLKQPMEMRTSAM